MKSSSAWLRIATAVLMFAVSALAKDMRDFAGFYAINNVQEQGNRVQLDLTVQVFNYSASDVKNATLALNPFEPGAPAHSVFAPIRLLRNFENVRMNKQVTIPAYELERWIKGSQPNLVISYRGGNGQGIRRRVELTRRPNIPLN